MSKKFIIILQILILSFLSLAFNKKLETKNQSIENATTKALPCPKKFTTVDSCFEHLSIFKDIRDKERLHKAAGPLVELCLEFNHPEACTTVFIVNSDKEGSAKRIPDVISKCAAKNMVSCRFIVNIDQYLGLGLKKWAQKIIDNNKLAVPDLIYADPKRPNLQAIKFDKIEIDNSNCSKLGDFMPAGKARLLTKLPSGEKFEYLISGDKQNANVLTNYIEDKAYPQPEKKYKFTEQSGIAEIRTRGNESVMKANSVEKLVDGESLFQNGYQNQIVLKSCISLTSSSGKKFKGLLVQVNIQDPQFKLVTYSLYVQGIPVPAAESKNPNLDKLLALIETFEHE